MPVSDEQKAKVNRIAQEYGLRLVLLFGSEVSGKSHQKSDVDVAVMFEDMTVAKEELLDCMADMQKVFHEREIDLGLINGADPLFLKKALENCELLYGEPRALAELKIYAFRRYIDHKRFLKMEEEYIRRLLVKYKKGAA